MKKLIVLSLVLMFSVSMVFAVSFSGLGTASDPYQIANLNDLKELSDSSSVWDMYFIQTSDINASATKAWNVGDHDDDTTTQDLAMGFSPIGENEHSPTWGIAFTGSYNGKGYKIDSLYINRPSASGIALFGNVCGFDYSGGDSSLIDSIYMTNVDITGANSVGSVVGYVNDRTTISNSHSTGIVNGSSAVGGLVGISTQSVIDSSYSTVMVTGAGGEVGGLVGINGSNAKINFSYSSGKVIGVENCIGGLAGKSVNGAFVINCYSTGEVNSTGQKVGGLVGWCDGTMLYNSYSTSSVSGGNSAVGGLVGRIDDWTYIYNSYSRGAVNGTDAAVGGLVGYLYASQIHNCYSTGSVTASGSGIGGLLGYNGGSGLASNNFWDTQTSGIETGSTMATGKTTAEMKDYNTFTNVTNSTGLDSAWDFVTNPNNDNGNDNYWDMDQHGNVNHGYPILTWQDGADDSLCTLVGVLNENKLPIKFTLHQNYPNPFNPTTNIQFDLPKSTDVKLVIYDIIGRQIRTLVDMEMKAGYKSVVWNGENNFGKQVASGIYIYRIVSENNIVTMKMLFIK